MISRLRAPAVTVLIVAALARPEYLIEIEAIAAL
jgi:enamine deaminase RidA (YjgF/YER057c/UK114 family)